MQNVSFTSFTNLDNLLKNGKADKPYIRQVYKVENTAYKWRIVFCQNKKSVAPPDTNPLLRKTLNLKEHSIVTAIMTASEEFIETLGIRTDVNTFFCNPSNTSVAGDYVVEDKLIAADTIFETETVINVVESFEVNPYLKQADPVINPAKGTPVLVLAPDNVMRPYYRHTEIIPKSSWEGDQSISQYIMKEVGGVGGNVFTASIMAQIRKDKQNYVDYNTVEPYQSISVRKSELFDAIEGADFLNGETIEEDVKNVTKVFAL